MIKRVREREREEIEERTSSRIPRTKRVVSFFIGIKILSTFLLLRDKMTPAVTFVFLKRDKSGPDVKNVSN